MKATWRVVTGLALLAGCGGGEGGAPESSADPRHNVLVIDDGFDLTVPALAGHVAAAYSIVCDHAARAQADDAGASDDGGAPADAAIAPAVDGGAGDEAGVPDAGFAQHKADLITALQVRDTLCHLEPGLEAKRDPLAPIARLRARWNSVILSNRYANTTFDAAELAEINKAVDAFRTARFHGTATAGLVAYKNPGVRLVLVEERLGSAESLMDDFTCYDQAAIDENVALFRDPDVRQAYIDRPASRLDDDIRALYAQHHLGLSNESFGAFSRQRLDDLQASKGCVHVDLRPYFAVLAELDGARAAAHPDPNALLVKSAGNDGSQIDGPEDHFMCSVPATPRLIIGADDDQGNRTEFTNFGACVDAFAPGKDIVVPLPGGWYFPLSGTSFSSPLVARLVSVDPEPAPYDPAAARALVLSMRDGRGSIPKARFPAELLYDPASTLRHQARPPMFRAPELINLRKLRAFDALLRRR
jgi:hypothetical protein